MMVKKGDFMFKKLGQIKSTESEAPHLETEEGKVYKVSFVVAFVWERLDGKTNLATVQDELENFTEAKPTELKEVMKKIVNELISVNLLKDLEATAA